MWSSNLMDEYLSVIACVTFHNHVQSHVVCSSPHLCHRGDNGEEGEALSKIPAQVRLYLISSFTPLVGARRSPAVRSEEFLVIWRRFDSHDRGEGRGLFSVAIMGNLFNFYPPLSLFVSRVCM